MSKETVQQVVTNYFAAIRQMDADAFVACFAAEAVSHDPVGAPPFEGEKGLRRFFSMTASTFDRLDMRPDNVFINGQEAAVKWTAQGQGKNGRSITFEGINLFTIDEGKIQTLRAYWDARAMMAQLKAA